MRSLAILLSFSMLTPAVAQDFFDSLQAEDDRRLGNFLFRGTYHFQPFSFELIWAPHYRSSILPVKLLQLPDFIRLGAEDLPGSELQNSTVALKLDLGASSIDGSLSYFRGYMPLPGVYLHPDSVRVVHGQVLSLILAIIVVSVLPHHQAGIS